MSIIYHEQAKQFHLYNRSISYIIQIMANGQLGNLYYGKRITDRESYAYLLETGERRSVYVSNIPSRNIRPMEQGITDTVPA